MISNQEKATENNTLSFHLLRSKFNSNNQSIKKLITLDGNMKEEDNKKKSNTNNGNTLSKKLILSTKKKPSPIKPTKQPESIDPSYPGLKRNTTSNSIDLNSLTPSLWSSNSTHESDQELDSLMMTKSTVPRTGSFANELSQRLAQSEKKGETLQHMIPTSPSCLTLQSRKSAPPYEDHGFPSTLSMHQIATRKSVPTSTSSPSFKRSATISSLSSCHSNSSSTQTTLSNNKKNWFVPHWFHPPHPSSPQVSPVEDQLPAVLNRSSAIKRTKVIQELWMTEKNYQTDMKLVKEIYYDTAHTLFSKIEMKHIFINLLDLLEFEEDFMDLLNLACQKDEYQMQTNQMTIGIAFNTMMQRLEQVYAEYCKKHEDTLCKIQEYSQRPGVQTYLSECKEKLQGRTTSWDLPSLLIKPVQRVLKYPLLLKEIVALTPEFHVDYEQLVMATNDIQQVADHINEIKKRKDLVEHLIHDKKKVVQGMNKKITRRVYRKKIQQQGMPELLFEDIYKQFEFKQEIAAQFIKDVQFWLQKIKLNNQHLFDLVDSLDEVYQESDGIGLRSISEFRKLANQLSQYPLDNLIEENVYSRISSYLKLFKNPSSVIEKRNRKFIDFNRYQYLISKGETPDKQLETSKEAYISLNAYLIDELPTFLTLADEYFHLIFEEYITVQSNYWQHFMMEWKTLTIDTFLYKKSWSSIETDYQHYMDTKIQWRIDELLTQNPLGNNNPKKHNESNKPMFECSVLTDYEKDRFIVHKNDIIQIWLTSNKEEEEWFYCSNKDNSTYGWIPSFICSKQ